MFKVPFNNNLQLPNADLYPSSYITLHNVPPPLNALCMTPKAVFLKFSIPSSAVHLLNVFINFFFTELSFSHDLCRITTKGAAFRCASPISGLHRTTWWVWAWWELWVTRTWAPLWVTTTWFPAWPQYVFLCLYLIVCNI